MIQMLLHLKNYVLNFKLLKKMHNATLKKRIIEEDLKVPNKLHKAIYEVGAVPWTYPRLHFIKNNQDIPMVCPECGFKASVPRQIQLHHESPSAAEKELESPLVSKKSSLKGKKDYYTSKSVKPICANCHSLEHHPRGEVEKPNCGIWLNKKTTNRMFDDYTKMFVTNCPADYTLQKKYLIRTILKTPN
uniref:Putative LAGLIDADG homing endonuclease n=1 Tax=Chlamydomonas nivalis TaxID=47906 RepID=A0A0S2IAT0_9CHLO|nr:putative LAGLIDADG homing endonuclease [Chlamydomonas nivalis]